MKQKKKKIEIFGRYGTILLSICITHNIFTTVDR